MNYPTKKTFYILLACIISLTAISFAKNLAPKNTNLLSLDTSSSTGTFDEAYLNSATEQLQEQTPLDNFAGQNLTDDFSKSFFAKYYNNGEALDNEATQNLISEATNAFKTVNLGDTEHYSFQNLKIMKDDEQNLRTFANTFITKEAQCLDEVKNVAKSTEDPIKTGNLYKKCAETFMQIGVTTELSVNYLDLVNLYYLIGVKIYSLEAAKVDPLKALVIMKEIGSLDTSKNVLYQNISNIIKKSGIIFTNEEPGKAWLSNTQ